MQLIDGKATAAQIKSEIARQVQQMIEQGKRRPHLAAILVGHDGGSETYVASKVKACDECGFKSTLIRFESDVTEQELLATIDLALDVWENRPDDWRTLQKNAMAQDFSWRTSAKKYRALYRDLLKD